jgi:hypothetical protein
MNKIIKNTEWIEIMKESRSTIADVFWKINSLDDDDMLHTIKCKLIDVIELIEVAKALYIARNNLNE